MANSSNTGQFTSFFNTANAVGENNESYISCVTVGRVFNFRTYEFGGGYDPNNKNNGNNTLISGSMTLNNQTKAINKLFNSCFDENENKVWLQVKFWGEKAIRFRETMAALDNPESLKLVLCGSLELKKFTGKDGTAGQSFELTVRDWRVLGGAFEERSLFDAVKAVKNNKQEFISFATAGYVHGFQTREFQNGTLLTFGRMRLNNQTKAINELFNSNYNENEENVWLRVQMWHGKAIRFRKMMDALNDPEGLKLVLVGSVRLDPYRKKDGTTAQSLNMDVEDWYIISDDAKNSAPKPSPDSGFEEPTTYDFPF